MNVEMMGPWDNFHVHTLVRKMFIWIKQTFIWLHIKQKICLIQIKFAYTWNESWKIVHLNERNFVSIKYLFDPVSVKKFDSNKHYYESLYMCRFINYLQHFHPTSDKNCNWNLLLNFQTRYSKVSGQIKIWKFFYSKWHLTEKI